MELPGQDIDCGTDLQLDEIENERNYIMDLTNIDISQFDLVKPTSIQKIELKEPMKLIDIEVEDNHTFFFKSDDSSYLLTHNCDGIHISSIYLGWFAKFAPWMFEKGMVCRLNTPLAIVFKDKAMSKIHQMFFDLNSFKKFESENDMTKYTVQYYKGLGSFPKDMFIKIFKENGGMERFLQVFKLDDEGKLYIDNWLNGDKADERKRLISDYTFDIDMI